jgi:hypothetical protein
MTRTFVVRVWTAGEPDAASVPLHLGGVVEDMGSGESSPFRDEAELLERLRDGLTREKETNDEND